MESGVIQMENEFKKKVKKLHFFDSNCWIGKFNIEGSFSIKDAADLVENMDRCGIDRAIVSQTLSIYSHPKVGNELLYKEVEKDERLYGCFILLPHLTEELGPLDAYIGDMLSRGIRAVRLFPVSQNYLLEEWTCDTLLGILEERRIPLFIWKKETDWNTLYKLCKTHPKLPVVLEQCDLEAFFNGRYIYPLFEKCDNFFLEVHKSHLYLEIDDIVQRFGAERLLFSSFLPVDDPYAFLMLITEGDFSQREKELIAHGNLEKLLKGVVV